MKPIISPCVQLCVMDRRSGYCRGCARTLDEIIQWVEFSEEERKQIMQQLESRKKALKK